MYAHEHEYVLVDLPGLIAGAHDGVGLGDQFLGHAERTKMILHIIDGTESDWVKQYRAIRHEMTEYDADCNAAGNCTYLSGKPEIIVVNKIDAADADDWKKNMAKLKRAAGSGAKIVSVSAAGRTGIAELIATIEKEFLVIKNEQ